MGTLNEARCRTSASSLKVYKECRTYISASTRQAPRKPLSRVCSSAQERQASSTGAPGETGHALGRRQLSFVLGAASLLLPFQSAHAAEDIEVLYVGSGPSPSQVNSSITDALAAARSGARIVIAPGRYRERLRLYQAVTLEAAQPGSVEVVWETQEPYQSVIEADCAEAPPGSVLVRGLVLRHYSKSVANNYGVFIKAGAPRFEACDISSASGSGIGVEGAQPALVGCVIHDCARHGVAIFGSIEDPFAPAGGVVQGCDIRGNELNGVLVRGGASPDLLDNKVHDNKGWGIDLQDCAGRYEGNQVYGNKRGAVSVTASFDLDLGLLGRSNRLTGALQGL